MAITLETLASGDINYINKHNNNYTVIKGAIDALQLQQGQGQTAVVNFPAYATAMLGAVVGRFSEADVVGSDGGSALLDITAGSVWVPGNTQVRTTGAASLDFTGQATDTYFTHLDTTATWSFDTSSTDAVHTIGFTSPSTFTTIVDPLVVWGSIIYQEAKISAALGSQTFEELDLRLEAGEGSYVGRHAVSITTTNVTLTTAEAMNNGWFDLSGTLTGNRDLEVPDFEKQYLIRNNTSGSFTVTVKTVSGTGVVVNQGAMTIVVCDGTDVLTLPLGGAAGGTQPMVIGSWKNGVPTSSERMLGFTFPSSLTNAATPADIASSSVEAEVAATSQTDFDILKNDSSFGTLRFAALGTVATFVSVTAQTWAQGDRLEIIAPGTADATLADIYFTIAGTRDQ